MRILFIAPRYHTNQYPIVKTLKRKGHKVKFLVKYKEFSEEYDILKPNIIKGSSIYNKLKKLFKIKQNGSLDRKLWIPSFIDLYDTIKKFAPDLVIIRNPNHIFSLISAIISKLNKAKIIFYTQGPLNRKKRKKEILKEIFIKFFSAAWITPVKGNVNKFEKWSRHAYFLPLIKETNYIFNDENFFENNLINIICVAKFIPKKQHLELLWVINKLKNIYPLSLTVIGTNKGSSYHKKVIDYVKDNNLSDIINFKYNLDYKEVQKEYIKNDLFILPSRNEQFGVSTLEAMAHGLPVICSNDAGCQYYIEKSKNGFIFDNKSKEDLLNKIKIIINDKNKLIKMGRRSYEIVNEKYSSDIYYNTLLEIIDKEFNIKL